MSSETGNNDRAFELIEQEARITRTARMLDETKALKANQRKDIIDRFYRFIEDHGYTQNAVAREIDISSTTISEILRQRYSGKTSDSYLAKIHNWMELTARRNNLVRNKTFVEITVASEIMMVAKTVADTCKMGVVFGPAHIGKSMTLQAIAGEVVFGDGVVIRINESILRPLPLCRAMCAAFELSTSGTFDMLFHRIVSRLKDTKRMLIFDEADRLVYKALETIRDLHDQTGCPVLFAGKPKIYEKLGFRHIGQISEVTDQLAARIVIKRDLMARTRGKHPQPLFTLEDIRKIIHSKSLHIDMTKDALRWLQSRACTLGMGGIGNAIVLFYLASQIVYVGGRSKITSADLDQVEGLTMGHEVAEEVAKIVALSDVKKRVV